MTRRRHISTGSAVLTIIGLLLVAALGLSISGCGDDEGDSSTTSTAGVSTTTGESTTTLGQTTTSFKTAADYEASIPGLTEQAKANPTDLVTLQQLAIAQYQARQYDEAAATYAAMLAVEDSATTHNNLANVLRDQGKTDEARNEYETALTLDPGLAIAYMNLASLSLRLGDSAEALAVLERGIAKTVGADQQRLQELKATIEAQPAG